MHRNPRKSAEAGMTLLELIIACAILLILSSMALPIARFTVIREREKELRLDLREMRQAIDKYKDLADQQKIRVELGSEGYPPDLDTLVKGVALGGSGGAGKKYTVSAAGSEGSYDGTSRVGYAVGTGRCGFDKLGREECVRCVFEVDGDCLGRNEVFRLVACRAKVMA